MVFVSTDGSFVQNPERCGFGVHVEKDGQTILDRSGYTTEERFLKSWNVSSELIAAILGVSWAATKGYTDVTLYYDYTGVENFVTGVFKARSEIAKLYVRVMVYLKVVLGVNVTFVKVKGHSGHGGNESADALAGRYDVDRTEWLRDFLGYLDSQFPSRA